MPTRRRPAASRTPARTAARRRARSRQLRIAPEVVKSLVGIVLALLGVALLIGLTLQGQGALTDWILNVVAPWFGAARYGLPFLLLLLAYYVERAKGEGYDWQLTLLGAALGYAGLLGLVGVVDSNRAGYIGRWEASVVAPLVTEPGAFIAFAALGIAGGLLALDMSLHSIFGPLVEAGRQAGIVLLRPAARAVEARRVARAERAERTALERSRAGQAGRDGRPGQDDRWPEETERRGRRDAEERLASVAVPAGPGQLSATFAPPATAGSPRDGRPVRGGALATAEEAAAADGVATGNGLPAAAGSFGDTTPIAIAPARPEYHVPPLVLLEDIAPRNGDSTMDHRRNAAIIEAKLASFNIPARIVRWNAGPVVTQYEVEPAPEIKVSRIEALSDDLAMALAARTIRVEAPIPGKSVVGIEIPNKDFNIVSLRRIMEEVDFGASSKLTFALGRDVAGHARAADLAKMPHLLIAGATGSGKSVMVNALITSLLCNATPDEVRFILVDLKRVELNAYNGLPHLMVPVITEPERAKAALKWAVAEMETRYRRFAGATARNIAGFNESRADPADRLPFLVIIVDELADLMMREGRDVEDPIVRLAQKARATGIHLVLATQRPSVNVVTGLIKANFPSRIAFAMASQIDSRTILDMPGAEDLIGRGDMLFQPADLPRPIRLQGVFVADKEITAVTEHWRAEAEPHYDLAIVETDEGTSGTSDDLNDEDADRLLPDAIAVIEEYDRASASLLQRRLKVGYARAARIIDQLEARGHIGAFDGSNARQVLRRDSGASGTVGRDEDEG